MSMPTRARSSSRTSRRCTSRRSATAGGWTSCASRWRTAPSASVRAGCERRQRDGARLRRDPARLRAAAGRDRSRRSRERPARDGRRRLPRPSAQLAQRHRREVRRQHLVHRPELRVPPGLRPGAAARRPRLPLRRRRARARRRRVREAQRACLLAARVDALRRRQRGVHDRGVRRARRPPDREPPALRDDRGGLPRRAEGRQRRQRATRRAAPACSSSTRAAPCCARSSCRGP